MLRKVRRKIFGKQEVEGKEKTLLQMRGASWIPDKDWRQEVGTQGKD
jgi:hypothetical protein